MRDGYYVIEASDPGMGVPAFRKVLREVIRVRLERRNGYESVGPIVWVVWSEPGFVWVTGFCGPHRVPKAAAYRRWKRS